jgi:hypothetical protein
LYCFSVICLILIFGFKKTRYSLKFSTDCHPLYIHSAKFAKKHITRTEETPESVFSGKICEVRRYAVKALPEVSAGNPPVLLISTALLYTGNPEVRLLFKGKNAVSAVFSVFFRQ